MEEHPHSPARLPLFRVDGRASRSGDSKFRGMSGPLENPQCPIQYSLGGREIPHADVAQTLVDRRPAPGHGVGRRLLGLDEFTERTAEVSFREEEIPTHDVKVECRPGLEAEQIGPPEGLPYPLPPIQQEPSIGEVQMDIGDQVLRSRLESEGVPQNLQCLAISTDLLEKDPMPEKALSAGIALGHFGRHLEREFVLTSPVLLVAKPTKISDR
jgi:hypothetical protein